MPKITKEISRQCEDEITKNEVKNALPNMIYNKTLGNDSVISDHWKKDKDERIIKDWKPKSLLIIDSKIISKNPISAQLFILVLEVLFVVNKPNQNFDKLIIIEHDFLYTAYVNGTTFFVKKQRYVI